MEHTLTRTTRHTDYKYCLESQPGWRRPAFVPTVLVLSILSLLDALLILISFAGMLHNYSNQHLPVLDFVCATAFAFFLILFAARYFMEAANHYELDISDDEIKLLTTSAISKERKIENMLLKDIDFVEYFTPRDNAALVFHARNGHVLDVPLYAILDEPASVIQFFASKDIKIRRI
ncbi:MAG: hypothetical protein K2X81_19100 [Candidatus Obscuribacterales bacterium]|nr:hypothetical protein [Candidatus Obscuribacterales bacterium]